MADQQVEYTVVFTFIHWISLFNNSKKNQVHQNEKYVDGLFLTTIVHKFTLQ